MRNVSVHELVSGDILARPIFSRNGVVLLDAGTELTESYIQRLKTLDIDRVSLRPTIDSLWTDSAIHQSFDMPQMDWRLPDLARMKDDEKNRKDTVKAVMDFTDTLRGLERMTLPMPQEQFREQVKDIFGEIVNKREFSEELSVMLQTDPLLFRHALQVTVCADVIGAARKYDSASLYNLTLGTLFSDIGMSRLPTDLTKVTRELTESERSKVRSHTTEGFRILKRMKDVPAESAKVALQHHERYHGEGYPYGLANGQISEMAQIAGIADVYNALVSNRYHRKAYAMEEATEYLFAAGNYEFDLSLVQSYLQHLTIYPVKTHVLMNSGQAAYVVDTSNRPILRPVVQIYREADGSAIASPYLVDLEQHPQLAILRRINARL